MGKQPTNAANVSPKVTGSAIGSGLAVILAWIVGQVPVLSTAPTEVQAALVALVVAGVTFAVGYFRKDPARF